MHLDFFDFDNVDLCRILKIISEFQLLEILYYKIIIKHKNNLWIDLKKRSFCEHCGKNFKIFVIPMSLSSSNRALSSSLHAFNRAFSSKASSSRIRSNSTLEEVSSILAKIAWKLLISLKTLLYSFSSRRIAWNKFVVLNRHTLTAWSAFL